MRALRKGNSLRLRRRKKPRTRLDEATERARQEGREIARRNKAEQYRARIKAQRVGFQELRIRGKGAALETRRRLRPVVRPVGSLLSWLAPIISRVLLFLVKLPVTLIALVLEATQAVLRRLRAGLKAAGAGIHSLSHALTPARAYLVIAMAAAVGIGVSQFFDYHGVAVDVPEYSGEVGSVAPPPLTDTVNAGGAHLYILLPIAIAAVVLIAQVHRGRTDLIRWVALCGLAGVAVSVAIDLPQGLDAGRPGIAFSGAEAQLLAGFWAQLSASLVLLLCGSLLMFELGRASGRVRRDSLIESDRRTPEVGSPTWQAGS